MRNIAALGRKLMIDPRRLLILAAFAAFSILANGSGAQAQDVGDPVAGHLLAKAWCSNCHVVDGNQPVTVTGAPPFSALSANRALSPLSLRAFFQTPHDRMPDLHLSNTEMDDLIAYILSSRGK